jgi:DNA-binding MarR family transcriptional regulator
MKTSRRLTDRQIAVLAAVERSGQSTLDEIADQFPDLDRSGVLRVLAALVERGRVSVTRGAGADRQLFTSR